MKKLLRIDASSRMTESHSRKLADEFEKTWLAANPDGEVIHRDVVKHPLPHIHEATITGFYTPIDQHDDTLKQAVALSDEVIEELQSADEILISSPLYNFSIPSALKAYIDHISRAGFTFSYDENGFKGLVNANKAYVATAKGAVYAGTEISGLDMMEPYLKLILNFLGIEQVEFLNVEGTSMDENAVAQTRNDAITKMNSLM
ncbi:MAG: NAD(P)H-dependent oxidoreductase [Bacteroidota bacterium]